MAYATAAKVQGLVQASYPSGFSDGTPTAPTSTQIGTVLTEVAAEIDVYLATVGYTTPVTSPAGLLDWLELVNAEGAAAMALKALAPGATQSTNGGPVIPAYAFWETRYQNALKRILNRELSFPGAVQGNGSLPSTYLTDHPDNDPSQDGFTDGQQPAFSVGTHLREF